jgi:hypothetical protein
VFIGVSYGFGFRNEHHARDLVRAGAGNRIHANHVLETFDGIDLGDSSVENRDIPLTHPDDGRDTEIWDNVIERTRDSGMELGAGCINVRVHHNSPCRAY